MLIRPLLITHATPTARHWKAVIQSDLLLGRIRISNGAPHVLLILQWPLLLQRLFEGPAHKLEIGGILSRRQHQCYFYQLLRTRQRSEAVRVKSKSSKSTRILVSRSSSSPWLVQVGEFCHSEPYSAPNYARPGFVWQPSNFEFCA